MFIIINNIINTLNCFDHLLIIIVCGSVLFLLLVLVLQPHSISLAFKMLEHTQDVLLHQSLCPKSP